MNLHEAANSIDVAIQGEPAEWWQVAAAFTPLATLLVLVFAIVASCGSTSATSVRSRRRAESWSRIEWAIEMALDDKAEHRKVGLALLDQLSTDHLVGKADAQIVAQARAFLQKP